MTSLPTPQEIPLGELATRCGITLEEVSCERTTARMPVAGNRQPFGLLHGGANALLAETIGSIHANLTAGGNYASLGIELSCTHHRAATAGFVTAVSTPLHTGRTMASFEIVIYDEKQRRTCTARLTCLLRKNPAADDAGPSQ